MLGLRLGGAPLEGQPRDATPSTIVLTRERHDRHHNLGVSFRGVGGRDVAPPSAPVLAWVDLMRAPISGLHRRGHPCRKRLAGRSAHAAPTSGAGPTGLAQSGRAGPFRRPFTAALALRGPRRGPHQPFDELESRGAGTGLRRARSRPTFRTMAHRYTAQFRLARHQHGAGRAIPRARCGSDGAVLDPCG